MIIKNIAFILFILTNFNCLSQVEKGNWYGVLNVKGREMPLGISIENKKVFIPPNESVYNAIDSLVINNAEIIFFSTEIGLKYSGKIENDRIQGFWMQAGQSWPLILTRKEVKTKELKRPQTPIPPFVYYTEELTIENKNADLSLSGTLTLPAKDENTYPVVVLISGTGPQNRDSEVFEHKLFAVIADHLAKQGIGSFRYDERGVAKSTGKYVGSDLNDFQSDVNAIITQLLERKEIEKLGLLGHSEGGIIAPRYASENRKKIDFVIMMGAPGVPLNEVMHKQREVYYKSQGLSDSLLANILELNDNTDKIINTSKGEIKDKKLAQLFSKYAIIQGVEGEELKKRVKGQLAVFNGSWYNSFIVIKPNDYLKKVKCPVLALGGGKDINVDSKANLAGISESLNSRRFCKVDTDLITFGSLNHLMQPAVTGNVDEYANIETTNDRDVLFAISE